MTKLGKDEGFLIKIFNYIYEQFFLVFRKGFK